jgi:hypothetical protein
VNYFIRKAILFVIVFIQAFNAHAYLRNNNSDLVKPIYTKATINPQLPASGVTKTETGKVNADKPIRSKKKVKFKIDKQSQVLSLLKSNQTCGSWFDASGSTGDAAAYEQIKASGYTKSNAPAAVKEQIAIGVAKCDSRYLVEKPMFTNDTKAKLDADNPQLVGKTDEDVKKPKAENGFFARILDGFKHADSPKGNCNAVEQLIHSGGC